MCLRYMSEYRDTSRRAEIAVLGIYIIWVPIKFNLRRNRRSLKMARPCEHPIFLKKTCPRRYPRGAVRVARVHRNLHFQNTAGLARILC
eukprot:SAG31_NODE_597_length_13674_cov_3.402947_12_plen_89_part_00